MSNGTNVPSGPGVEHYHGNVKCYSKSCSQFKITDADRIVRDPCLVRAPVETNWRDQTDHLRTEVFEKKLGMELGPEAKGFKEPK